MDQILTGRPPVVALDSIDHPNRSVPRRWLVVVGLVASWVIPLACHLAGLDVALPVLVWLLTASLIRSGRNLLDRLVLALALLFGASTGAGLLFSVWPSGLRPVPIAAVALTVLVAAAAATGRMPRLPRPAISDALLACAGAGAAAVAAWPLLRRSATDRLAIVAFHDDFVRHFSVFEGIRSANGYVFLHTEQEKIRTMVQPAMYRYPQGSHFVYALLDNFRRGSGALGDVHVAIDHYIAFTVGGFFFMALAAVWATRWIGGAWLGGLRYLVPVTAVAAYCGFGEPIFEFATGHSSEIAGAALVLVLVAVTSRPLRHTREQVVLVAALLIGIGFTYYLFLPGAGLAALGWLVFYRRRLRPVWRTVLVAAVLTVVLAPVVPLLGLLAGQASALGVSPGLMISREFVSAMAFVVIAGLLGPVGRRLPALRGYAWSAGCLVGVNLLLGAYQMATIHGTGYYFEKAMTLTALVVMVGLGATATLLPRPRRVPATAPRMLRLTAPLPALLVTAAILMSLGRIWGDSPYRSYYGYGATYGEWFAKGMTLSRKPVTNAERALAAIGDARGGPVTVLTGDRTESYFSGLYLSMQLRSLGTSSKLVVNIFHTGRPRGMEELFDGVPTSAQRPAQIAVTDAATVKALADLQRRRPDIHLVVHRM